MQPTFLSSGCIAQYEGVNGTEMMAFGAGMDTEEDARVSLWVSSLTCDPKFIDHPQNHGSMPQNTCLIRPFLYNIHSTQVGKIMKDFLRTGF